MIRASKKAGLLYAGALIVAQVSAVPGAQAFGFVDTDEDKAKCVAEGGEFIERDVFGEPTIFCDTPEKDAACADKFGDNYYYDYLTSKCSDVPF